jgi:hypothetical protein
LRITKYRAKAIDEIRSDIKITYVLYRILGNGCLGNYAQSEDFDKLTNNKYIKSALKGTQFVIKKRVTMVKEEPIFKVKT